eukprot:s8301_g2.t1
MYMLLLVLELQASILFSFCCLLCNFPQVPGEGGAIELWFPSDAALSGTAGFVDMLGWRRRAVPGVSNMPGVSCTSRLSCPFSLS